MIQSKNNIKTDSKGKELKEYNQLFNFIANEADVHQYLTDCISPHWHKELEIFILLEGHVKIGIEDQRYTLSAGEGCFINSNILHSFSCENSKPCLFRSFVFDSNIVGGTPGSIFDISYVRPILKNAPAFYPFYKTTQDDSPFFSLFHQAFYACKKEYCGYELDIRYALSKMLFLICRKFSAQKTSLHFSDTQEKRIKQMLTWIDTHLREPISVFDIAESANICTRECQRIFKRYLHYSPMSYVKKKRILYAADQLSKTDLPITDIAMECGFASPSHFSKQFHEIIGSTPRDYRNTVRTKE